MVRCNTTKRKVLIVALGAFVVSILTVVGIVFHTKSTIHEIFKLNQERKAQGYYLSEFEWEMLAAAHYLDAGQYVRSLLLLDKIHEKLSNKERLTLVPHFATPEEALEFYLGLQDQKTGAFMRDNSLPLFTFIGPTANMISLLVDLSAKAGKPFRLKYPLSFLDGIDAPEKLVALLDEASHVGWLGAKFKTPYVCVAELGTLADLCERHGLRAFSPEWKKALYDWFYENQDPQTGLWGPRSRADGRLIHGGSLTESERVVKMFVDRQGNQLYPDYPLRHADRIIASALAKLAEPMPDDLDKRHEWILAKDHGTRFITRYLWPSASMASKSAVKALMEDFIELRFVRYYVAKDGAFSLYPDAQSADLDGTGEAIGMYKYLGALDSAEQERLWGAYSETVEDLGERTIAHFEEASFDPVRACPGIRSIRVYPRDPKDRLLDDVSLVYYPREIAVLDASVLLPKARRWLARTPQRMGNWVTRDSLLQELQGIDARAVPSFMRPPVDEANRVLEENGQAFLAGFDLLQAPLCKILYRRAD